MALSKLLVKAQLNVYTKLLTVTDLIAAEYNTAHGYTLADCKGMFKITGPNSILYKNDGWDTDDYSSPDTDGGSLDWDKSGINLPLDSSGNVLLGVYQIEYKVTLDGTGNTNFTFDKNYTNMYVAPSANIVASIVIKQSYMIVTDSTNYKVAILGVEYSPTNTLSDSRVLTGRWPAGSGVSDTVTNLTSMQLGPNLWTGNYDLSLSVLALYTLPAEDSDLTIEISDTITGVNDSVNVRVDNCTSTVQACLLSLTAQYEQAKQYNLPEAQSIKKNLDDIMLYYEMYKMAVSTGSDTDYSCGILRDLLVKNGCTASSGTTSTIEVTPESSLTGKDEFIVVDTAGQSVFNLTFVLKTTSMVIVEGQLLLNSQVSGFGSTVVTISWTVPQGQTVIVVE